MKEKIQDILHHHEKIILFHENDIHFGTTFRAATKTCDNHVITLERLGGVLSLNRML